MVAELTKFLRGWHGYYRHCDTPSVLHSLDSWIRRRLRAVMWRRWKRGPRRYRELRKRGVGGRLAACTVRSHYGPWCLSRGYALNIAFPNTYFRSLGLPTLAPS